MLKRIKAAYNELQAALLTRRLMEKAHAMEAKEIEEKIDRARDKLSAEITIAEEIEKPGQAK